MIKKSTLILMALILGAGVVFFSCAGMEVKPTAANFKAPVIALELIEVPQFDGYYYYAKSIEPTKGTAGDHGAPLPVAVTFNITNDCAVGRELCRLIFVKVGDPTRPIEKGGSIRSHKIAVLSKSYYQRASATGRDDRSGILRRYYGERIRSIEPAHCLYHSLEKISGVVFFNKMYDCLGVRF